MNRDQIVDFLYHQYFNTIKYYIMLAKTYGFSNDDIKYIIKKLIKKISKEILEEI